MEGMRLSPERASHLLYELCTKLGFCLAPDFNSMLANDPPASVDAFTDAVLIAEGMNPQAERHLRRQVREMVAKHFERAGLGRSERSR